MTEPAPVTSPQTDASPGALWSVLSYLIGPVPLFVKTDSPFIQYHAKQGTALLVLMIVIQIVIFVVGLISSGLAGILAIVGGLIGLAVFVVAIIGILKMMKGERWELPVLGPMVHKA